MSNKPLLVERKIEIRAYDIDVVGFVSNIVYVRWFEDLRHYFLDVYCPYKGMIAERKTPILTKTEIEYKMPLTIYDSPLGRCWMSSLGRSKWEMSFEIVSGDELRCRGRQWGCFFDLEKQRPVRLPQSLALQYAQASQDGTGS